MKFRKDIILAKKTKGEVTKDEIIKASISLFSKNGYDATSVQEIADLVGLSQANVFYHFSSKRKLFEFTVHKVIEHNRELINKLPLDQEDPLAPINRFISGNVTWAYKHSNEFQIIMLLLYFSVSSDKFKKLATEIFENGLKVVASEVERLKQIGVCKSDLCPEDLARIIQQYVNGVQYQIVSRSDGESILHGFQKNLPNFLQLTLQL